MCVVVFAALLPAPRAHEDAEKQVRAFLAANLGR